jgi:hypothetical protein
MRREAEPWRAEQGWRRRRRRRSGLQYESDRIGGLRQFQLKQIFGS